MRLMSSYNNERCGLSTCCLELVLGVIAAVIFGTILLRPYPRGFTLGVDIALEVAVIVLILLFVGAYLSEVNPTYFSPGACADTLPASLASIIGTIAASTIALSILLAPGLISSAIAVAVVVFFYTLMLTETAGFLLCFACKAHRCKENE